MSVCRTFRGKRPLPEDFEKDEEPIDDPDAVEAADDCEDEALPLPEDERHP